MPGVGDIACGCVIFLSNDYAVYPLCIVRSFVASLCVPLHWLCKGWQKKGYQAVNQEPVLYTPSFCSFNIAGPHKVWKDLTLGSPLKVGCVYNTRMHDNKRVNCANSSHVFSLFWFHPLLKFNVSWLNNRNLEFTCRQTWAQQLKMIPLVSLCVANHTEELAGNFSVQTSCQTKGKVEYIIFIWARAGNIFCFWSAAQLLYIASFWASVLQAWK